MSALQQTTSQVPNQYSRPYPNFSLPALSNPTSSSLHGSGSSISLIGGVQPNGTMSGYNHVPPGGHTQHTYLSGPPGQARATSERPFKCDQCVQSFSRNHDLKRHKRIHLAIKPYPCQHCDKSFSRKDALKVCYIARTECTHSTDKSLEAHSSKRMRQGAGNHGV